MKLDVNHSRETANNVELHVASSGAKDGPEVMFLHGFPEFWYGWRHQIPFFANRGYHVRVPDLRGYNRSDKPSGVEPYSLDRVSMDVIRLIVDGNDQPIRLVGHDWGGAVAWWIAAKHPSLVSKLVILNVPHPKILWQHLNWDVNQNLRSWYMYLFQPPYIPELISPLANWWFVTQELKRSSLSGTFTEDDLNRYRRSWEQPGAFHAMLNWYRAAFRYPPENENERGRVGVPTKILWGTRDVAFVDGLQQESLELCDQGEMHEFSDATHWIHHERAGAVNELIHEFINDSRV